MPEPIVSHGPTLRRVQASRLPLLIPTSAESSVFIEAEDTPSELEILDELARKGCFGTAAQKKEKRLPYHQDYIDFAEKMKAHDPQLAERFFSVDQTGGQSGRRRTSPLNNNCL
jgi:hypothetical protein